jgi:XTP/dITP diphosphohydrolase
LPGTPIFYRDVEVSGEEVKRNWEQLKLKEGKKSLLEGVPASLPAMVKAYRSEKTERVGFVGRMPNRCGTR